jgi:hydroxypyruvate isomerase
MTPQDFVATVAEVGYEGVDPYPAIMRAIHATGYDGYIGQELMPRGDPVAALRIAFDVCNVSS